MDKIVRGGDPVKGFPPPDPGGPALSAEGLGRMCSHLEAADQEHAERLTALAAALEELTEKCSRIRAEQTRTIGLAERQALEIRMLRAGQEGLRQKVRSLAGDVEAVEEIVEEVEAAASQAMSKAEELDTVLKREDGMLWESVESLNRRVQAIEDAVEDEPETALSPRARISMN